MLKKISLLLFILCISGLSYQCKTVHLTDGPYVVLGQFADHSDANERIGYAAKSMIKNPEPAPIGSPAVILTRSDYKYGTHTQGTKTLRYKRGQNVTIDSTINRSYVLDIGGSIELLKKKQQQTIEIKNQGSLPSGTSAASLAKKIKSQEFTIDALRILQESNSTTTMKIKKLNRYTRFNIGHSLEENNIKKNSCHWFPSFFGLWDDEPNAYVKEVYRSEAEFLTKVKKRTSIGLQAKWKQLEKLTKNNASISLKYESGTGENDDKYSMTISNAWSVVVVETFKARSSCK